MKRLICGLFVGVISISLCVACGEDAVVESGATQPIVAVESSIIPNTEPTVTTTESLNMETYVDRSTVPVIENSETDDGLLGQWIYEDNLIIYGYTFNDDGSGEFLITDGSEENDVLLTFTYTVNDDGSLDILHENTLNIEHYLYSISDSMLTLTDSNNEIIELYLNEGEAS